MTLVVSRPILQGTARKQQVSLVGWARYCESSKPYPRGVPHAERENSHARRTSGVVRLLGLRKSLLVSFAFVCFVLCYMHLLVWTFSPLLLDARLCFGGRVVDMALVRNFLPFPVFSRSPFVLRLSFPWRIHIPLIFMLDGLVTVGHRYCQE